MISKKFLSLVGSAIAVLAVGVAIPKLTVHDQVPVDERVKRCADVSVLQYDNIFERMAFYLGKSRIISASLSSAEIESFTLFRIPLGVLRGKPDMKLAVSCSFIMERNTNPVTGGPFLYLLHDLPSGWYMHRSSDTSMLITKQEKLPVVGDTEGQAYGEQVGISLMTTTLSPQAWAASQQWLDDAVLVKKMTWSAAHGHALLLIEHETPAAPQLTGYLFTGKYIYAISLYPLSDKGGLDVFNGFIEEFSKNAPAEAETE